MAEERISLVERVTRGLRRRKEEALRGMYGRSGRWARLARFPVPLLAPWRASEVHLRWAGSGIGDILLCTPVLRELKRRNPHCRLHFYTHRPELLEGLPYIDEVHGVDDDPGRCRTITYANATPAEVHLARVLGDEIGLEVRDVTPDCAVDEALVERWRSAWRELPRPHFLVLRRASDWTPNKNWQDASWVTLAESLSRCGTVIEIGAPDATTQRPGGSYLDLRGQTNVQELVAAVSAADLYIGPISGPMHIAAAVKTEAVVIVGGYEHPRGVAYKGQTYLYSPVECAPCWLREPCPFNRKCLAAISAEAVEKLVRDIWVARAGAASETGPEILYF